MNTTTATTATTAAEFLAATPAVGDVFMILPIVHTPGWMPYTHIAVAAIVFHGSPAAVNVIRDEETGTLAITGIDPMLPVIPAATARDAVAEALDAAGWA